MKKILVLFGFVFAMTSMSVNAKTLSEEDALFASLDREQQIEVVKMLYKKMKERDLFEQKEKDAFVEAFAKVSQLTAKSISANKQVELVAPGFRQAFGSNINYKKDTLFLKPSVTYLMNFRDKTVDSNVEYREHLKNDAVYVYFDAIRNMVILRNPGTRTAVINAKNVSLDEIKKQILTINPDFNF